MFAQQKKKIASETSEYVKTFLNHLETSDYSFLTEILSELQESSEIGSDEVALNKIRNVFSRYDAKSGSGFTDWLYRKNIKAFFESAVDESRYLTFIDFYTVSDGRKMSFIDKNRLENISEEKYLEIKEKGFLCEYEKSFCRYSVKIDNDFFAGNSRSVPPAGNTLKRNDIRIADLIFDFSDMSAMAFKTAAVFTIFITAGFIVYLFSLLMAIKSHFVDRIENISSSLSGYLKGRRDMRTNVPGKDSIGEIGNSINKILDESIKPESGFRMEKDDFSLFFENIPFGMIVLDNEGKVVYENNFIKSLFKGDYEQFSGLFSSILSRADSDLLIENLSSIISGEKKKFSHSCRLFKGAYRDRFFEIRITSIDRTEHDRFIIICFYDLSFSETRSNQHSDFYRIDGMSRMAGNIANGLNNILQIINGYTEYLMLGGLDEEEFRDVLENMINAGKRASVLTRHLKIFSKGNRQTEPVVIDINSLIGDLENIINDIFSPDIKLILSNDDSSPECLGDESQLEQVIINLCINAREAIEGNGVVEISSGTAEYTEEDVLPYPEAGPGKYTYVKIKDTGHGIPENQMRKIFEPFFSSRKKGESSGMGLSVSNSIIINHKGFIHVESEEGKGSIFTVNIPAAVSVEEETVKTVPKTGTGKTVLFVDDEELIVSLGKIMLEKAGYNVLTASGGNEAVEIIRNYKDKIDIMVFDLVMPDLSGREAVEIIYRIKGKIPVLYISGYAEKAADSSEDMELLGKPFKSSDLISRISGMLER